MAVNVGNWGATAGLEGGGNWRHSHRLSAIQHIVSAKQQCAQQLHNGKTVIPALTCIPVITDFTSTF